MGLTRSKSLDFSNHDWKLSLSLVHSASTDLLTPNGQFIGDLTELVLDVSVPA